MLFNKQRYSFIILFILIFMIFLNKQGFAFIKFKTVAVKPRLIIFLLDETDSFGQNSRRGIAEHLYWDKALQYSALITKKLKPSDELVVLAIDEKGFEEEDILIPYQQIEKSFLKARLQKKKLSKQIKQLTRRKDKYKKTDILGALFQAAYFAQKATEHEVIIFCFSDMRQEPRWPSLEDAADLTFPNNTVGYFFFVDASGKDSWQHLKDVWEPIFKQANLRAGSGNLINFYQQGESEARITKIVQNWKN